MRTVLHLLPHPGGGGETYVDALESMDGYRLERVYLAPTPNPTAALRALPRSYGSAFRSADLIHVHGEIASAICLPLLTTRKSVITLHGLNLLRRSVGVKRRIASLNLRLIARAARATICVSESEHSDVARALGPGLSKRVVVIRNGIDVPRLPDRAERQAVRAELGIPDEAFVGLWVGGLEPVKNAMLAVTAATQAVRSGLPMTLLVVGDGPERARLEAARAAGPSDAVRTLGHRRDIPRLQAASDFYVNSSIREGLAFALLEAMALGLPPVVSDVPGNLEAVGEAGFVARSGGAESFVSAFREVADEDKRREIGSRARDRVVRVFGREEMVGATRELYDRVLRHGRLPVGRDSSTAVHSEGR
jgi:glycosyltransferase involved in cell wall biosynthesis